MDYKHSIDILSEYIKEIEALLRGIGDSKKIPVIDIDLMLDKTRNFYEMLNMLKNNAVENPVRTQEQEEKKEKTEDVTLQTTTVKIDIQPNTTQVSEAVSPQPPLQKIEKEIHIPVKEPVEEKKGNAGQKILSDRFSQSNLSLNERMSQGKNYGDLASKLQSKPIANIAGAIGLNEKFAFIHHLFRGDAYKFNETVHVLDNSADFNEAYNYLIENFSWDMDNELVQKILELIRRKFIKK
ncbi:MAG: hypothetical protein HC906_00620 [Bacteroidales bacterium]|nr:hypothetical protein [Bacteroidales bacterium]